MLKSSAISARLEGLRARDQVIDTGNLTSFVWQVRLHRLPFFFSSICSAP
jgi:hypothetical protein